jgi:hypothetical protein
MANPSFSCNCRHRDLNRKPLATDVSRAHSLDYRADPVAGEGRCSCQLLIAEPEPEAREQEKRCDGEAYD